MVRYQLYDIEGEQVIDTVDTLVEATDRAVVERLTRYVIWQGVEDADGEFIADRARAWRDPLAMAA